MIAEQERELGLVNLTTTMTLKDKLTIIKEIDDLIYHLETEEMQPCGKLTMNFLKEKKRELLTSIE